MATYSPVFVREYTLPPVDEREVLRYAGHRGEADETLSRLLKECIAESESAFCGRVCYREASAAAILEKFGESALVRRRLTGAEKAVVFAATVGLEIDRLIVRCEAVSPAKALLFQALGAERIESLCDTFCADMQTGARFSAGYGDFPLQAQEWFFSVLEISKRLGVTLNSGLLMTPTKSVTAIAPIVSEKL